MYTLEYIVVCAVSNGVDGSPLEIQQLLFLHNTHLLPQTGLQLFKLYSCCGRVLRLLPIILYTAGEGREEGGRGGEGREEGREGGRGGGEVVRREGEERGREREREREGERERGREREGGRERETARRRRKGEQREGGRESRERGEGARRGKEMFTFCWYIVGVHTNC